MVQASKSTAHLCHPACNALLLAVADVSSGAAGCILCRCGFPPALHGCEQQQALLSVLLLLLLWPCFLVTPQNKAAASVYEWQTQLQFNARAALAAGICPLLYPLCAVAA
jgi:hypothetical protein